jgi:hypothetical protein
MRARESAPGAGCTPPASACTRRLTDLAAGAGNSRMTHAIKNTARTRCATPPSGRGLATCAGGAAERSGRSSAPQGEVQEAALPTHPPARAACAHRVSAEFNYVYGRVLTRVLRAVRVMQPLVSSCAVSACEHGDVQDQDAGGVVPARTDRAALPAGRILPLLGVSSCALEAMPRSCACSCSVLAEARRKVNIHLSQQHSSLTPHARRHHLKP